VPVLYATRDAEVQAVPFTYACHPTSRPKHTTFHPDWPGVATARLEDRYREATAVFLQGCGADQNPYPDRTEEYTEKHGETVALAVEAAVEARGKQVAGPLPTCAGTVPLRFGDQSGRDELQRRLGGWDGTDRYARRFLAELDREGEIRTEFPYQIGAVGFSTDLTLVTLGREVPVGYAHRIRSSLAGDVAVAGCSNQGYVYVPTARILREGGHEATWVFLYWRYPAPLEPSNESRITETALALAQRVGASRRETAGPVR
jgi:neutral ceramidase